MDAWSTERPQRTGYEPNVFSLETSSSSSEKEAVYVSIGNIAPILLGLVAHVRAGIILQVEGQGSSTTCTLQIQDAGRRHGSAFLDEHAGPLHFDLVRRLRSPGRGPDHLSRRHVEAGAMPRARHDGALQVAI